jgi:hypothetical protein
MTDAGRKTERFRATGAEVYSPDAELIERSAAKFRWEPQKLRSLIGQFGKLPLAGQEELIDCLGKAFGRYQMGDDNVQRVTPSETLEHLRMVETSARKLLELLGIDPKMMSLKEFHERWEASPRDNLVSILESSMGTDKARSTLRDKARLGRVTRMQLSIADEARKGDLGARETRFNENDFAIFNAQTKENMELCNSAILGLFWLYRKANSIADIFEPSEPRRRGGAKRCPTREGQLIRDARVIYAHMRKQYPESGQRPGPKGSERNFSRLTGSLFGIDLSDDRIDEALRPQRQRGPKPR